MPAIVLKVPPWEGRYEFEDWRLTQRELHEIKLLSGVRAAELIEALYAGDRAACLGLAIVILDRHDKVVTAEDLWDSKVDEIVIDFTMTKADDADPPTQPAAEGDPNEIGSSSGDGSGSGGA